MPSKTKSGRHRSHPSLFPAMRDFTSCFSEHAVKVSDYACSGSSSSTTVSVVRDPSVQTAVTSVYRCRLSTCKEVDIRVTWNQSDVGPALSIGVDDYPRADLWHPKAIDVQHLWKKEGTLSYDSGNSEVDLSWDISMAKYGSGLEPVKDYYIAVVVDAEFALLLGDRSKEFPNKFDGQVACFSMIYRTEQLLGRDLFTSKVRFNDIRGDHEITIKCMENEADMNDSELSVLIDKRKVVRVRRLRWNFRGNQTIFVDGHPMDVMWDLHDWFFCIPSGSAMFTFRMRRSLERRLWLEELMERKPGMSGVSLLIQAFKSL